MADSSSLIEDLTIQPVPDAQRTGRARHLFSIWFGVQIMPLTLVTGVLGPTVFGLGLAESILAIVLGNAVGAIFMALHSIQGSRLGVPQMIQARGQFGMYGSLLVLAVVIMMYVGFLASILILARDTLLEVLPDLNPSVALIGCAVVTLVIAVVGYEAIHKFNRYLVVLFGLAVVLMVAYVIDNSGDASTSGLGYSGIGFAGMVSTAAVWQLAYAPYVSDYSRYLPTKTSSGGAFWFTFGGTVVGAVPVMVVGAMLVTVAGADGSIASLTDVMPAAVSDFVLLMLFIGAIDAAVINLYGPSLCTLTLIQTFLPGWSPRAKARNVVAVITALVTCIVALKFADDFLVNYSNFIYLLMGLLIPWSIINLADYYLIKKGEYDPESFTDATKGYGAFNVPAVITYVVGFLVQLPFMNGALVKGPFAKALDGIDISWAVGSVASFVIYLGLVRMMPAPRSIPAGAQIARATT